MIKGCNQKFVYQHEEEGVLIVKCGKWKEISKTSNHQILKYCYDCLDDYYEKELVRLSKQNADRSENDE